MNNRKDIRIVFAAFILGALGGAFGGHTVAQQQAKRTAPRTIVSEIIVVSCGDYLGTIFVTGDGRVREFDPPEGAAITFGKTLPDGAAMIAHIDDDCRPKQST